jgi:acyl-CoA synthetase (AMP-forming)/AMP-acid ligase II/acyl carrier protein
MSLALATPSIESRRVAEDLASFIRNRVNAYPDLVYTEIDRSGEHDSVAIAELHRRAQRMLARLNKLARPEDAAIVVCAESVLDFIPAVWACIYGGYSCLPLQVSGFSPNRQEIELKLATIHQKLNKPILLTTRELAETPALGPSLSQFRSVVLVNRDPREQSELDAPLMFPAQARASDPSFLIFTSGTTSAVKIAMIGYRCAFQRLLRAGADFSTRRRLLYFPFDGITGLWVIYPTSLECVYLQPSRLAANPVDLLRLVEQLRPWRIGLTSSMLARVLDAVGSASAQYDLSSLEDIGLGAEMIVPDLVRRLDEQFRTMGCRDLTVSFSYGMTETGLIASADRIPIAKAITSLRSDTEPVSVGTCLEGIELRIVDDHARELPPGNAGNVEVRSKDHLFGGYLDEPELNAQSFTSDGWFKTGDIGQADRQGALTVLGRTKATIILNGKKFSLEAIEAPLRPLDGIHRAMLAAAAVRAERSPTDELAVFFVPRCEAETQIDELCRVIKAEVAQRWSLPVKYLVPVAEADFPVTAAGKIKRDELVRRYQAEMWRARAVAEPAQRTDDKHIWLAELWKSILRLAFTPASEANFFELGGDSFASAEMIFAVEEEFSCELPIEAFFRSPTIATLTLLLEPQGAALSRVQRQADGGHRLLRKLQGYVGSWPGERLFADSLVVGMNLRGTRPLIFWVFQGANEFEQLAKQLGPDQPLYGMRSCEGIVTVQEYSAHVLETVSNRYLWEILALAGTRSIVIGGNCQGGILALALAKRLLRIGRAPSLLILMEWAFSYGSYAEPILLLYGEDSHTAQIYRDGTCNEPKWRDDFPACRVAPVPGAHGHFFSDENVAGLAQVLQKHLPIRRRSVSGFQSLLGSCCGYFSAAALRAVQVRTLTQPAHKPARRTPP